MPTPVLFIVTVLIWGTSWYAIKLQIGPVPLDVSVFYRMALAALILLAGLAVTGRLRRPARWRFVVVQALCLFSFNFVAFYHAAALIPSGMVAVIFSLASIFNAINARVFFGERITAQVGLAGVLGVVGVSLMFWRDLAVAREVETMTGIGWALLGAMIFSWGNMASRVNSSSGVPPLLANAWGLAIGALALLGMLAVKGEVLVLPQGAVYWAGLLYLAVFASVIGFTTYLVLVWRIGSAKAGYATVLFPVVAMAASTLLEGFEWTPLAGIGVVVALFGNLVMFWRGPAPLWRRAAPPA
ncbi:DMT family transporter [Roseovarius sp. A21]|uniref:DMT family transporter n=1 Tax=Roseovarius bejariae TaxID=2576383 RepID=A0A844CT31_9RHOB|nr:DMT family transporter [Roseovarius bejariae]MRU14386.1 DMT family transporter [Roseovarius bejariae]